MTKKDYIKIAKAIARTPMDQFARSVVAEALAKALHEDNPRFDRQRFIEACRYDGPIVKPETTPITSLDV